MFSARMSLIFLALPTILFLELKGEEPPRRDGVFVAVGYGGRRLLSRDGTTWEITAEWEVSGGDNGNNLMGLVFAQGKFVAVGGGGGGDSGAGHILVSGDGKQWREVYAARNRINPVAFGNGRFVVGAPGRKLLWSDDAEKWTAGPALGDPACTHFRHGAFGNDVFVFVGNGVRTNTDKSRTEIYWAVTSAGGEKILHEKTDLPPLRGLAFGAGRFVGVGVGGVRIVSRDGATWERHDGEKTDDFTWIVWTGREFLTGGGKQAFRSADGLTWERWEKPIPCAVLCVREGKWIGTSWPGRMWHSADGKSWERGKDLTPNGINQAAYGVPSK